MQDCHIIKYLSKEEYDGHSAALIVGGKNVSPFHVSRSVVEFVHLTALHAGYAFGEQSCKGGHWPLKTAIHVKCFVLFTKHIFFILSSCGECSHEAWAGDKVLSLYWIATPASAAKHFILSKCWVSTTERCVPHAADSRVENIAQPYCTDLTRIC